MPRLMLGLDLRPRREGLSRAEGVELGLSFSRNLLDWNFHQGYYSLTIPKVPPAVGTGPLRRETDRKIQVRDKSR